MKPRIRFFLRYGLCASLVASSLPQIARAGLIDGQRAAEASHESAKALAQAMFFSHINSAIMSVNAGVSVVPDAFSSSRFEGDYEALKNRVFKLTDASERQSLIPVEDQVLEQFSEMLSKLELDYRTAEKDWHVLHSSRTDQRSQAEALLSRITVASRKLSSLCKNGIAQSLSTVKFPSPIASALDYRILIGISGSPDGSAAPTVSGGDSSILPPELQAAVAVGGTYLAMMPPYGTLAAIALWIGHNQLSMDKRRAQMWDETEGYFYYYEHLARSNDVQAEYRSVCLPMLAEFESVVKDMESLRSDSLNAEQLSSLRADTERLRSTYEPILNESFRLSKLVSEKRQSLLKAFGDTPSEDQIKTVDNKIFSQPEGVALHEFIAKSLVPEMYPKLIRLVFVSAALKIRDGETPIQLTSEDEARAALDLAFEDLHQLSGLSYRLKLMKQNPMLVKFLENEIQENETVREMYGRWIKLLIRAMAQKTILDTEGDLGVSVIAFSKDVSRSLTQFPQSLGLRELRKRAELLRDLTFPKKTKS